MAPEQSYQQRLQLHQQHHQQLLRKRSRLGWLRLFVFLLTIGISYAVFTQLGNPGFIPLIAGLGILLFLVSRDVDNNRRILHAKELIRINEEELRCLRYDFTDRFDGNGFQPHEHPYANDLDLFGPSSLYQWINRCATERGRGLLAANLLQPLSTEEARQRQEAAREMAPDIEWRQEFGARAQSSNVSLATERKAKQWIDEEERIFTASYWKILVEIYTIITIGSAGAAIFGYLPAGTFSGLFGLYLAVSMILSRNTIKPYLQLTGIVNEVATLQRLMEQIESREVGSRRLLALQQEAAAGGSKAGGEIRQLKKILDRFDVRLNVAGLLFFNSFLLWDVRQMLSLNEWRRRNRERLGNWFAIVAEMEVIHTLATLRFNQPDWCEPQFHPEHFHYSATALGHPLLPAQTRVNNDFDMEGRGRIALITGSNMAGKSTFLRSLGVNLVLARMGAPVCAKAFTLSPSSLVSSMRIADNLAENTSTFYAELKKLKSIIESVNRHEPLFILLDEILRGTNSLDRHTGSAALIRQLIRQDAVAVIATHDVELAGLANEYPKAIGNYHFDVQVEGEELYFDYRLKPGICTSLNASILMRKIGIELQS